MVLYAEPEESGSGGWGKIDGRQIVGSAQVVRAAWSEAHRSTNQSDNRLGALEIR